MKRSLRLLVALFAAMMLIAAACGDSDDGETSDTVAAGDTTDTTAGDTTDTTEADTSDTTEASDDTVAEGGAADESGLAACQVTDAGGIDDKSFNETAFAGLQRAESDLGVSIDFLESQDATDFAPNIQSFLDQGCDLIFTVGFLLAADTADAAVDNPDQLFAIIDDGPAPFEPWADADGELRSDYANVRALNFATDEAGFLAGYLAAGMTETGVIGTFGGINIPPVTIFMDGYLNGADYYNEQNGTGVRVLGWDGSEGLFTGDFESLDNGRSFGQSLINEGADIILPVAGPVGLGTAAVAQEVGGVSIIGVDADQFEAAPDFGDVFLTSILKKMDNAVFDTVQGLVDGGGLVDNAYVGTLANDGVGLASFHDFEDAVPQELKDELEAIRLGIIDGSIDVSG